MAKPIGSSVILRATSWEILSASFALRYNPAGIISRGYSRENEALAALTIAVVVILVFGE